MTTTNTLPRQTPGYLPQQNHRRLIGILGLCLPILLIVIAAVLPTDGLQRWSLLNSVSAYYYTAATGVFVGILFTLALFLVTYPGYEGVSVDRWIGRIGGLAALGVALFPTAAPPPLMEPTWWSPAIRVVHYASAIVLFLSFILFSTWLFRKSEYSRRRDRPAGKRLRDDICLACGVVMSICVLWALSAVLTHAPIFLPEAIAIMAFAVSWLVKGKAHRPVIALYRRVLS